MQLGFFALGRPVSIAKATVRRVLARAGLAISRIDSLEDLSTHLWRQLEASEINCVFDVGAHEGKFGRQLRDIGYSRQIVSFEPVAKNFAVLQGTAAGDRAWRVCNYGLGARTETADINIMRHSTLHSMLLPSAIGRQMFGTAMEVEHTEKIQIRRLDEVAGDFLTPVREPRIYLKLDTQGYDLAVIQGSTGILDKVAALQTEVAVQSIYADMQTTLFNTVPALQKLGIAITGLFPVSRAGSDGLQVIEFDCVMSRCAPPAQLS